jgi:hypothetical protein
VRAARVFLALATLAATAAVAPSALGETNDHVLVFTGPAKGPLAAVTMKLQPVDDSSFSAETSISGWTTGKPRLDGTLLWELGSQLAPHMWVNGTDALVPICGTAAPVCAPDPTSDNSTEVKILLEPGKVAILAYHGKITGRWSLPRHWKITAGHGLGHVATTNAGVGSTAFRAYVGALAVEQYSGSRLRGGPHLSIAMAQLPCDQAGQGSGTLSGGGSPIKMTCAASFAAATATRATTWDFNANLIGATVTNTRLVVIDI